VPAPPGKKHVQFVAAQPAPTQRELEKKAEAAGENIIDAARTNMVPDMGTKVEKAAPATKTAGPTYKEEIPWPPPPAPAKPFKTK
jgi:hypothetical protein